MSNKAVLFTTCLLFVLVAEAYGEEPSFAELESQQVTVGEITIERLNVFDEVKPNERLRSWINRSHTITRENVIRSQILFDSGSPVSKANIEETERLLRNNKYLHSADISVKHLEDGVADLLVTTQDLWTLSPELDFSSQGGETYYTIGIEDDNLLGTGAALTLSREKSLERTSNLFLYSNNNFMRRRINFAFGVADSNDGNSYSFNLSRPFFSLDTPWSAGLSLVNSEQTDLLYRNGDEVAEYLSDVQFFNMYRGWSTGRRNNWVNRFKIGFAGERSEFTSTPDASRDFGHPSDRTLYYPYVSFDVLEDDYQEATNFRSIGRVEDIYLGTQYGFLLGYASKDLASDRNSVIVAATTTHNFGSPKTSLLTIRSNTNTRIESGKFADFIHQLEVNWNLKQTDKWRFATSLKIVHTENTELDKLVTLGGSNDLRGYPLRHRNGRGHGVLTVEQRYFSNWYPRNLFRIGGAIFVDVGQVWGSNVFGETNDDLLMNVGIGLRLASTKSGSKKVIHFDLATPIDADSSIDSLQFVVEAKQEF